MTTPFTVTACPVTASAEHEKHVSEVIMGVCQKELNEALQVCSVSEVKVKGDFANLIDVITVLIVGCKTFERRAKDDAYLQRYEFHVNLYTLANVSQLTERCMFLLL